MKILLSESEIAVMRATSTQVMKSLQLMTEIFTIVILGMLVFDLELSTNSNLFEEITVRLFTVYALQLSARGYIFWQNR